jgi:hypothetical protein
LAIPAPMPFDAPVTTATLPASFDIVDFLRWVAAEGLSSPIVQEYGTIEPAFKAPYLKNR